MDVVLQVGVERFEMGDGEGETPLKGWRVAYEFEKKRDKDSRYDILAIYNMPHRCPLLNWTSASLTKDST